MRYLRLFENLDIMSIKKTADDYNKLRDFFRPLALKKYYELANNDDYDTDDGSLPDASIEESYLGLIHIFNIADNYIQFELLSYDYNGNPQEFFYIDVTEQEIKNFKIEMDAKKYNL